MDTAVDQSNFFNKAIGGGTVMYTTGMLQPGVVALQGPADNPDILLTWGLVPSARNIGGAVGRLEPRKAWSAIEKSLAGDFSAARPAEVQGDVGPPLPVFLLLLMANGNFLAPKPFTFDPRSGQGSLPSMFRKALMKAVLFLGSAGFGLYMSPRHTLAVLAVYSLYFRLGGPYASLHSMQGMAAKAQDAKL